MNILNNRETMASLVLTNACIAFAILSGFSPANSRPILNIVATTLGMASLYPIYLLLQKPRRYRLSKETQGENVFFIIKMKGFLWWYNAKNADGKIIAFKTTDEAKEYVKENVVLPSITNKMKKKATKHSSEVVFDSKDQQYEEDSPEEKEKDDKKKNNHKVNLQKDPHTSSDNEKEMDKDKERDNKKRKVPPTDNNATLAAMQNMVKKQNEGGEETTDEQAETENNFSDDDSDPSETTSVSSEESTTDGDVTDQQSDANPQKPGEDDDINRQIFNVLDQLDDIDKNHKPKEDKKKDVPKGDDANTNEISNASDVSKPSIDTSSDTKPSPGDGTNADTKPNTDDGPSSNEDSKPEWKRQVESLNPVHGIGAEMLTDTLDKLNKSRELRKLKTEGNQKSNISNNSNRYAPSVTNNETVPQKRQSPDNNADGGIPTKKPRSLKSSMDERQLKSRIKQSTIFDLPDYVEDKSDKQVTPPASEEDTPPQPHEEQPSIPPANDNTAPPAADEEPVSSGGQKIVKKLEVENTEEEQQKQVQNTAAYQTPETYPKNEADEVFTNGSENQTKEPEKINTQPNDTSDFTEYVDGMEDFGYQENDNEDYQQTAKYSPANNTDDYDELDI